MRPIVCSSKMRRTATDLAATDPADGEDDFTGSPAPPGADILTYSLSGADKDAFVIVGSIENAFL